MDIEKNLYKICLTLIDENYNKYFKCRELVDEIIAIKCNTTISYIVHSKRRMEYFYGDIQKKLTPRVTHVLKNLEKEGIITKYNTKFWVKINHGKKEKRP